MKNVLLILLVIICTKISSFSQTTLTAGQVAIIGYSSDDPDQVVFLLLKSITAGTEIKFTDRGWNTTTGTFYSNPSSEGTLTWTADVDYEIGTEIKLEDAFFFNATLGSVWEFQNFDLSTLGDQILVYQGTDASPTFLNAVHLDSAEGGWGNGTSDTRTALPPGLTDGLNAIYFTEIDNATFACPSTPVEGSAELVLAEIVDIVIPIPIGGYTGNWFTTNIPLAVPIGGDCDYYICSDTTIWDGTSWDKGVPDINMNVELNADYDTSVQGSFSACGLTVNSTFKLTIKDNTYVEVQKFVRALGEIETYSKGSLIQIEDETTFKLGTLGMASANKTTTPLVNWYDYTYWSSPVASETVGSALAPANSTRRFWFDASNYIDVLAEVGNTNTFVPGNDDICDNNDCWTLANGSYPMTPGIGFAASHDSPGFVSGDPYPYTFSGPYNTGIITTPILINAESSDNDWNLIGNPYPSAINSNTFFTVNAGVVDNAIYIWSHNTPSDPNAPGNSGENFAKADYAIIVSGSGNVAGGDGIIPTDFIGSGQGFFVRGIANGNATFNNSMRMVDETSNGQFFRNDISQEENRLWLNLTSDNGVFNQILVAYVDGATNANDGFAYDATRNLSNNNYASIYTTIEGADNKKFAIQGKAPTSLNENEVIPIRFENTIAVPTIFTYSIARKEGDYLNSNSIFIKDNLLNTLHDLTLSNYEFTSDTGQFPNRFEVVFQDETLSTNSIEEYNNNDKLVLNMTGNGGLNISTTQNSLIKNVKIYDIIGRLLYDLNVNQETEIILNSNVISFDLFVVKATLTNGKVLTKKGIN